MSLQSQGKGISMFVVIRTTNLRSELSRQEIVAIFDDKTNYSKVWEWICSRPDYTQHNVEYDVETHKVVILPEVKAQQ